MESITKEIRKLLLAGLGAAVEGKEKGGKLLDELAEKGEVALEHGKVLNEELKHNIRKTISGGEGKQDILEALKNMDADQLAALKETIAGLEKETKAAAEEIKEAAAPEEEKAGTETSDGNE